MMNGLTDQPCFRRAARNRPEAVAFAAALFLAVSIVASLGAGKEAPPNREPTSSAASSNEKSVEALAASAHPSVVVVRHYGRDGKEDGVGAGFVVDSDGLIATCLHVIGEARPISVELADGRRFEATEVYAWDRKFDLAIIRIAATNLTALPLGDSDSLKQGRVVVAIGNPAGLTHSVVQGVVSARRTMDADSEFAGLELIQLAIPIEPGNSGGPLLDMKGRVHGLLTRKSAVTENLGFAMPVKYLQTLLDRPNPTPMSRWLTLGALNPQDWMPRLGARWSQKAGRILVEGLGEGFGGRSLCLSQHPVPDRPYELAVSVKLDDEAGAAGLLFASDGEDVHYGFYPTGGQLRLTRFDGPTVYSWNILQTVASSHYRPGQWNDLRVRVETNRILCYVNGALVIESDDAMLSGGKAGLAKFRQTKAQFRDFQIGSRVNTNRVENAGLPGPLARELQALAGAPDRALVDALRPHAAVAQPWLDERARELERQAAALRHLGRTLHQQAIQDELVKTFAANESEIDLFHAALLVARLDDPTLEVEPYRQQLAGMAREIQARLPRSAEAGARIQALIKYLFTESGFHGSRSDYYNRANSYMNEVLDDREGLPITLSILFIELAQRIGVHQVTGLPLPGHFMVRYSPPPGQGEDQIIDVFNGGKIMTRGQAQEEIFQVTGDGFRDEDYRVATKKEIIIRVLRNLRGIAEQGGNDALRYLDIIVALAPEDPFARLDRSRLRLQTGDAAGAKTDLRWILDQQPKGIDLERVEELLRAL